MEVGRKAPTHTLSLGCPGAPCCRGTPQPMGLSSLAGLWEVCSKDENHRQQREKNPCTRVQVSPALANGWAQ